MPSKLCSRHPLSVRFCRDVGHCQAVALGCLFVCIGLLALSFSRQQQDGDKGVERAAQDQNSVYDLFAILVRVNKHCDTPPEETYKDGKEEYCARELLVHLIIPSLTFFYCCKCVFQFSFHRYERASISSAL